MCNYGEISVLAIYSLFIFTGLRGTRSRLDLGRLFSGGKPRGFESVRTTDDKEDLDRNQSDSETEEFSNSSLLRKA